MPVPAPAAERRLAGLVSCRDAGPRAGRFECLDDGRLHLAITGQGTPRTQPGTCSHGCAICILFGRNELSRITAALQPGRDDHGPVSDTGWSTGPGPEPDGSPGRSTAPLASFGAETENFAL